MSGTTYNIRIVLSSDATRTSSDIDNVGRSARGAGKEMASFGGLVKEAASNFAGYLSAQAVFEGLTQAAKFAYDTIIGFDAEMTEAMAIMGDVSAETRDQMEATARSVAVDYNAAVQDVAQAYYFLASAGYDAATAQKAVGQVTAFAKAGMFDLETATEMAADAQNAMGLKSASSTENLKQLTRITDVLTKANIVANGSVEDFSTALTNKAAASARLAGVSLESTVAVLAAFAAQGLKGLKAGEGFSIVLRELQEKARTNADAFKDFGLEVFTAEGAMNDMPVIIGQIEKGLQGMSVEQANAKLATLGFTAEGGAFIKTLIGMSGEVAHYEGELHKAAGATQEIAAKQMESLAQKLVHLKVLAAELALQGFDKIVVAVTWLGQKFGPTFQNIVYLLASAGEFVKPLVEGMMMIAGAAVVGGLIALAKSLEMVTGYLREHEGIVQALATVGLVLLVARLAQAGAAFASLAMDAAAFKLYEMAGGIDAMIAGLSGMRAAFQAARAGGSGFAASIAVAVQALWNSVPAAIASAGALAAVGIAIYGVMAKMREGERAAEAFNKRMAEKHDQSSLEGLKKSIEETTAKMTELGKAGDTWQERINIPEMIRAEAEYNKIKDTVAELTDRLQANERIFDEVARSIAATQGPAGQSAEAIGQIKTKLDEIATAEKIDPTTPGSKERLQELAQATMSTTAPLQQLQQAFRDVADAGSTAEDAVKAYKTSLDALAGVHISAKQAEIGFAEALQGVNEKVGAGVNLLDVYNVRNREAASAVLGAANAAIEHAVSVFQETGSLSAANGVLGQHREQLVKSMIQTGMSRDAANAYIDTLGLTPKNIETLARLNKDQASAAANELTGQLNEAARPRTGSIVILTGQAIGGLQALHAQMDRVDARMRSMGGSITAVEARGRADGGIQLHQYAQGGLREAHVAQIAPPGAWRVWAEPETGGEAYIPLSPSKRGRSKAILAEVARMFGMQTFASGGYNIMDAMAELSAAAHGGGVNADVSFWGMSDNYRAMLPQIQQMWSQNRPSDFQHGDHQGLLERLSFAQFANNIGMNTAAATMRDSASWGPSFTVGPGAFVFHGGRGDNPAAMERAINAALTKFSRDMRREYKARRVNHRSAA